MEIEKVQAAIEAILFTMGDSVELSRIAEAVGHDEETIRKLIHHMMDRYEEEDRGIRIIELENAFQLCTKKEMYEYLIRVAKQPKRYVLTDVLLETLSIIAYKQPVTKIEIEKIRGVKSDHAVNKLVEYGLVRKPEGSTLRDGLFCSEQQKSSSGDSACIRLMTCLLSTRPRSNTLRKKLKMKPS